MPSMISLRFAPAMMMTDLEPARTQETAPSDARRHRSRQLTLYLCSQIPVGASRSSRIATKTRAHITNRSANVSQP
jgi:hypothetical protein